MKRIAFGIFILALMLTACAPPTPAARLPQPTEGQPNGGPSLTSAESAALALLSETLSLPAEQITLVSTEAVTWPDGCLGVERVGVMCTQALVDGYLITFEADGRQYEVRTNENGSSAILADNWQDTSLLDQAVVTQLAGNLGLDPKSVQVVSNQAVEFADGCLGVAMKDVMCPQVVTPGRIIVLEADGIRYEYHSSQDGMRIQPATLALTWSREGGIVGFCDSLTVFLSGEVYGNQCKSEPNRTVGTLVTLLAPEELTRFKAWIAEFGSVTLDASDPKGVADGMSVVLNLYGNGSAQPLTDAEPELFSWAQDLFQKLYE